MSVGIVEGYIGKKSEFIRTPKFNLTSNKESSAAHAYGRIKISPLLIVEFLFIAYGVFQIAYAIQLMNIPMAIFGGMFALGFGIDAGYTIYHSSRNT